MTIAQHTVVPDVLPDVVGSPWPDPLVPDVSLPGFLFAAAREHNGHRPKAFVVARTPVPAQELIDDVAARVAPYKQVRDVVFADTIPISPPGKILRRLLRDR